MKTFFRSLKKYFPSDSEERLFKAFKKFYVVGIKLNYENEELIQFLIISMRNKFKKRR